MVVRVAVGFAVATGTVAVVGQMARSWWRMRKARQVVHGFEEGCATSVRRLRHLVDDIVVEMHSGLDTTDGGSRMMLPTLLYALPDGTEHGVYYTLQLEATGLDGMSCRAVRVEVVSKTFTAVSSEKKMIPLEFLTGTSENFFDFLARELQEFIQEMDNDSKLGMKLGFAFPFPIKRVSHSAGRLFERPSVVALGDVSRDVSTSLKEAMARIGLNMSVAALVNDPVGTLALSHFYDRATVAAVQIGVETKACYVEQVGAIRQWRDLLSNSDMVVNMEWGNFWSAHLPITTYDIAPEGENNQSFSKLISEMYLGEIVRRVLYRIANEFGIFGGSIDSLSVPFTLRTSLIVEMHMDGSVDLQNVVSILADNFQVFGTCLKARKLVMRICDSVIRRAARLIAVGIVAILRQIGRDGSSSTSSGSSSRKIVIAIHNSCCTGYPTFINYIKDAIEELLGEVASENIVLRLIIDDGPGIGAALLAAVHPF